MKRILVVSIFFFTQFLFSQNKVTQDYINKYKNMAVEFSKQYSIPAEIILGIAIIESGAGKSKVVMNLNNHFGIVGPNNSNFHSRYKQYSNDYDSYKDFCEFISSKKYYFKLKNSKEYNLWVEFIGDNGYSGNSRIWKNSIINLIKKYKLDQIEFF